jgi:hypothetical protein
MEPSAIQNLMKKVFIPEDIQNDLISIVPPEKAENIQKALVYRLKIEKCPESQKAFICCEFNSHSNAFRSPFSNLYLPSIQGPTPSKSLRDLELKGLQLFEDYCNSFYKNAISSVYIKETSDRSYAMCFAVKTESKKGGNDIIHTIDLLYDGHNKIIFKLVTKFLFWSCQNQESLNFATVKTVEESANRQDVAKQEIAYMIKIIENAEWSLKRSCMNFVGSKPLQVIQTCRTVPALVEKERDFALLKDVLNEISFKEKVIRERESIGRVE